jgi:hypothetical protein
MQTIAETVQEMQAVLWDEANRAGVEEGFIKRKRKLNGSQFVQTVVFGYGANPAATTRDLNQAAGSIGVAISRQGLEQRYNREAAAVLKRVLNKGVERLIAADPVQIDWLKRFSGVRITDTSVITLPGELEAEWSGCGSGQSAVKVSVDWDLVKGQLDGPHLFDARRHDQAVVGVHRPVQAGELILRDLGYFNLDTFAALSELQAYWLSYYKQDTVIRLQNGETVDLLKILPLTAGSTLDIPIYLGQVEQVPARLIAIPLPPDQVRKRRKHLREIARRKQQPVSQRALKLAQWKLIVTNLPADRLSLEEIGVLLGCRWQIERLFRLWKEGGRIDEWRSRKPWHILCELYAKLLACLLQHWIILHALWAFPDRSFHQASKTIRQHFIWLATVFRDAYELVSALDRLVQTLRCGCTIDRSATAPPTFERLLEFELPCLN